MLQLVSSSSVVLVHDTQLKNSKPLQQMKFHSLGCSINTAIWAPNNQIIASGADDGQIHLQTPKGELLHTQQAYNNRNVPVNSLHFTSGCEFMSAGLQDGVIKIWDSKKKDFVRVFRSSTNSISSITSAQFNMSNLVLAASNLKGFVNLFPMNDILQREITSNFTQTPISEVFSLKPTDSKINSLRFSPFKEQVLACAQDDSTVSLYDINSQQISASFTSHKGSVRGVSFSTLSKLLLCSAGLDKFAYFYDIQSKMSVNKINLNIPIQSVSFASDGKTVAFGANSQGSILVYDLRNSKEPLAQLEGHKHTVHSVQFKCKEQSNKVQKQMTLEKIAEKPQETSKLSEKTPKNEPQFQTKTLEQLKEEAKRNVDMKLQKLQNQRNQMGSQAETQSVTTNFTDRAPLAQVEPKPKTSQESKTYQKLIKLEETKKDRSSDKIQSSYTLSQQRSPKAVITDQTPSLPTQFQLGQQQLLQENIERRQMEIKIEDTEMKLEDIHGKNKYQQSPLSKNNIDLLVKDFEGNQDQRTLIQDVVDKKFKSFSDNVQSLLNNFHIEIIRQFEIQKYEIDGIIKEYLVDPDDSMSEPEEIEVERDLVDEEDELDAYLE